MFSTLYSMHAKFKFASNQLMAAKMAIKYL